MTPMEEKPSGEGPIEAKNEELSASPSPINQGEISPSPKTSPLKTNFDEEDEEIEVVSSSPTPVESPTPELLDEVAAGPLHILANAVTIAEEETKFPVEIDPSSPQPTSAQALGEPSAKKPKKEE